MMELLTYSTVVIISQYTRATTQKEEKKKLSHSFRSWIWLKNSLWSNSDKFILKQYFPIVFLRNKNYSPVVVVVVFGTCFSFLPLWNYSTACWPIVWVWSQMDFTCFLTALLWSWDFLQPWWADGKQLGFSPMGRYTDFKACVNSKFHLMG